MKRTKRRNKRREELKDAAIIIASIDGLFAFLCIAGLLM